eukprot:TRINITY_DN23669_c0_g1_i1.p1 TRINITY_DN23669_c0_g1~~TRINITY_DN23669_c0_g1_i1.p1  ORF type:complete len:184 (+),score=19.71 TRINITY_DN23669_c0_g1_i1:293-844(+)
MVLVLAIGNLHVPFRASDLPAKFKSMLVPGKIQHVLCPGNLCIKEMQDYLKSLSNDVHITKGEYDEDSRYPETKVVTIGAFKIGLCHGHQVVPWGDVDSLAMLQRQLDVDVLVTGQVQATRSIKHGGGQAAPRLLLSPGSATGCGKDNPSFLLMDVDGARMVVYVYELTVDGEVKVEKVEFKK